MPDSSPRGLRSLGTRERGPIRRSCHRVDRSRTCRPWRCRIFLLDDHELVRRGVRDLLGQNNTTFSDVEHQGMSILAPNLLGCGTIGRTDLNPQVVKLDLWDL